MSEPRRHHVNPEHVLRRFATKRGQVHVLSRTDLTRGFITSVAKVAVERDFYALETANGLSQTVEKDLLAKLEADAAPAFDRMLAGAFRPSPEDRACIALFVAAQWLRGWDRREEVNAITEHTVKLITMNTTRSSLRRYFREVEGREGTEDEITRHIEFVSDPRRYRIVPHKNHLILRTLEMLPGIANIVAARRWQVVRAVGSSFVTSDAPVTLWSHPRDRDFGVGFGTASEITMPFDRRHALVFTHDEAVGGVLRDASEQDVWVLNSRTASSARKWVIHHPDDTPAFERNLAPPQPKITISGEPFRIVPDGA